MLGPTYLTTCHLLTLRRQQMWKTKESIMPSCLEQFSIIHAFKIKHVKGNPTLLEMISLIRVDQTGEGITRTRTFLASARAQEKKIAKTKLNAKRTKKIAFSSESKAIWANPQGLGGVPISWGQRRDIGTTYSHKIRTVCFWRTPDIWTSHY